MPKSRSSNTFTTLLTAAVAGGTAMYMAKNTIDKHNINLAKADLIVGDQSCDQSTIQLLPSCLVEEAATFCAALVVEKTSQQSRFHAVLQDLPFEQFHGAVKFLLTEQLTAAAAAKHAYCLLGEPHAGSRLPSIQSVYIVDPSATNPHQWTNSFARSVEFPMYYGLSNGIRVSGFSSWLTQQRGNLEDNSKLPLISGIFVPQIRMPHLSDDMAQLADLVGSAHVVLETCWESDTLSSLGYQYKTVWTQKFEDNLNMTWIVYQSTQ